MSTATRNQAPPDRLAEVLDELDAPALRTVRAYVERRLDEFRPPLQDQIRSEANGRVVEIEDCGAYTLVRTSPPVRDDSEGASRRLSLYRVKREEQPDGEESLHWSYLGDVTSVECGNCGAVVNTAETACPRCGEEMGPGNEGG